MALIEAEVLHIKTSICIRMPFPKDEKAVFINYPSVVKDQTSEEMVITLFCPVVLTAFSSSMLQIIVHHNIVKLFSNTIPLLKVELKDLIKYNK